MEESQVERRAGAGAVCCCNWKTNDMTWHGDILNRYGNYKELYYIIYIYIVLYCVFDILEDEHQWTSTYQLFGCSAGYQAFDQWCDLNELTSPPAHFSEGFPFLLHALPALAAGFKRSVSRTVPCAEQEGPSIPLLTQIAIGFEQILLQGGYGYTSQPFRKSWHGIVQVYSISQFWTICHWCFVFEPRAPQVFRIELVCCTFCSKWYCYFPTPWGISNHTTAWCLHNFRLASLSHFVSSVMVVPSELSERSSIEPEQWAARGFTRH